MCLINLKDIHKLQNILQYWYQYFYRKKLNKLKFLQENYSIYLQH